MTNEELIERARRVGTNDVVANPRGHRALIADLADALEAAAKVETARVRDAAIERAERAEAAMAAIREAVSRHPECDRYKEGDVISCGWKSAFRDVSRTLAALDTGKEKNA